MGDGMLRQCYELCWMKHNHLPIRTATMLLVTLFGCNSGPTGNETGTKAEETAVEAAVTCDPIVGEFRDLMADYESGLKSMIEAGEVDKARQEEWSAKAKDLNERIQARGERELGMKCWQEFNTISQAYAPRIAELGMKMAMIQMEKTGLDPAMMEQMKKAAGQ